VADPHLSPVGLVEAWLAWDRWARKLSARKARPTARSGAAVSGRLVDTEIAYADHLGISPSELHTEVVEGIRAGLSVADAVAQVVSAERGTRSAPPPER
jgi:uncharacterized NAD-dependent epimerase/dehydratase family protein